MAEATDTRKSVLMSSRKKSGEREERKSIIFLAKQFFDVSWYSVTIIITESARLASSRVGKKYGFACCALNEKTLIAIAYRGDRYYVARADHDGKMSRELASWSRRITHSGLWDSLVYLILLPSRPAMYVFSTSLCASQKPDPCTNGGIQAEREKKTFRMCFHIHRLVVSKLELDKMCEEWTKYLFFPST